MQPFRDDGSEEICFEGRIERKMWAKNYFTEMAIFIYG